MESNETILESPESTKLSNQGKSKNFLELVIDND